MFFKCHGRTTVTVFHTIFQKVYLGFSVLMFLVSLFLMLAFQCFRTNGYEMADRFPFLYRSFLVEELTLESDGKVFGSKMCTLLNAAVLLSTVFLICTITAFLGLFKMCCSTNKQATASKVHIGFMALNLLLLIGLLGGAVGHANNIRTTTIEEALDMVGDPFLAGRFAKEYGCSHDHVFFEEETLGPVFRRVLSPWCAREIAVNIWQCLRCIAHLLGFLLGINALVACVALIHNCMEISRSKKLQRAALSADTDSANELAFPVATVFAGKMDDLEITRICQDVLKNKEKY